MKQPKLSSDMSCSFPVNLCDNHIYALNPIRHLPTISSANYEDGSDHCGSSLGYAVPAVMKNADPGPEKLWGFFLFVFVLFSTDTKKCLV